ncbi:MAG: hypothetical protein WCG27_11370, partial [Pseudomonadota bacterium]
MPIARNWINLVVAIFLSASVAAADKCEITNDGYSKIKSDLQGFKVQIEQLSKKEGCSDIFNSYEQISTMLNDPSIATWQRQKDGSWTRTEIDGITKYTNNMASNISGLLQRIVNDRECFKNGGQKISMVQTLGKVIQNVTGLVGVWGGPHSIPITIGGSVLGSILIALDKFFQDKSVKFNEDQKRDLYTSFACTLMAHKKQVETIMNASPKIAELEILKKSYLEGKKAVEKDAVLCSYITCQTTGSCQLLPLESILKELQDNQKDIFKEKLVCKDSSDLVHNSESTLNLMITGLKPGKNEANSTKKLEKIKDMLEIMKRGTLAD